MITKVDLERYNEETVGIVIDKLSKVVFPDLFEVTQYNEDDRTLTCHYVLPNGLKTIWDIHLESDEVINFSVTFVEADYYFSAVISSSGSVKAENVLYKKLLSIFERIDIEQLTEEYEALINSRKMILNLLGDNKCQK